MAEIAGGELNFEFTANTEQLKKAVTDAEGKLIGFSEAADKAGVALDGALKGEAIEMLKKLGVESGKTGKEMSNALKDAEQFVGGMEKGMEVARGALDGLNQAIAITGEGFQKTELIDQFTQLQDEVELAGAKTDAFRNVLENFKDENASLSSKLREVRTEMEQLDAMGERNSAKYDELREKAASYAESIKRVNSEVSTLSGGSGMGALLSVMNSVSSVVTIASGAYGLLNTESEKVVELNNKIASVTAIAVGLQQAQLNVTKVQTTVTIAAAQAQQIFAAASTRLATALNISTVAARTFLGVMTGGLMIALPFVISYISKLVEKQREAARSYAELSNAMKEGKISSAGEITQLKLLYSAATDVTRSTKDREKSVRDLQKAFPVHFGNMDKEIILNGQAKKSYDALVGSIIAAARARALESVLEKRQGELFEKQEKLRKQRDQHIKEMRGSADREVSDGQGGIRILSGDQSYQRNRQKAIEKEKEAMQLELQFNKDNAVLLKDINRLKDQGQVNYGSSTTGTKTGTGSSSRTNAPSTTNSTTPPVVEMFLPGSLADLRKKLSEVQQAFAETNDQVTRDSLNAEKVALEAQISSIEDKYKVVENKEKKAFKNKYEAILKEQQTYEEKSLALQKEYEEFKNSEEYKNSRSTDKSKVDQYFSSQQSVLDVDMIKKSKEWEVAFGELEGLTNNSLQVILSRLLEFKEKTKGTLSLQDSAELEKAIERVKNAASNNPFENFVNSFKNLFGAIKTSKEAQQEYNDAVAQFGKDSPQAIAAKNKMIELDEKAAKQMNELNKELIQAQDLFNLVGSSVMALSDIFGGFDDATNDAIGNIMAIGNAAFDLGKSIASGNIAGMISAGINLIGSIGKALSGDQKREREIKKQAQALGELERAYDQLARAVDRAVGDGAHQAQMQLVENLKKQQVVILSMINSEQNKKKSDKNKIADLKQQYQDLGNTIEDIFTSISESITQTDAKSLASDLGDALVEAYRRGEDAAKAYAEVAQNAIRNAVINMLKVKMLEGPMQSFVDKLLTSMGFDAKGNGSYDGLTSLEIDELMEMMKGPVENFMKVLGGLDTLLPPETSGLKEPQGLKGDIAGITEKTAGALEAQINAMRINQQLNAGLARESLARLVNIDINTYQLHQMRKDLSEMNSKITKPLAGL